MSLFWGRKRNSNDYSRRSSAKKLRRFLSLVFVILLVLFLLNGVIKGERIGKLLATPLSSNPKIQQFFAKADRFDGQTKINVVIDGDPLLVASFDPNDKTIKILAIPASTYTQVAGGYGWYPIGSAYGLGELENPPAGGIILLRTASAFLAAPVDYYIKFKGNFKTDAATVKQYKDKLSGIELLPLVFKAPSWLKKNTDTNLTLLELYRLWWQSRSVRFTDNNYLDVKAEILEELLLPDESRGYTPKQDQLDLLATKVFEDSKIQAEGLSIEILNSTGKEGLAGNSQRLLENIGANVVNVGNYETTLEKSILVVNDAKTRGSYTVKRLSNALKLTVKEAIFEQATADLTIILGQDQF